MELHPMIAILNQEMELATGCTEPAAIAFTAAAASKELLALGDAVQSIRVLASVNIIKNALAAGIPGTSYTGIDYAAAIGAAVAQPDFQLQVLNHSTPENCRAAELLVKTGHVQVDVAKVPQKLYIDVTVQGKEHSARAVVANLHTNIILTEADGKTLFSAGNGSDEPAALLSQEEISGLMSVEKIYHYIDQELDPFHDPIDRIHQSIEVNTAISNEGMTNDYGLKIGKLLEERCQEGIISRDMATNAMIITAAGADARMAGAPVPVVANSGSGNQGITTTMPVVATAKWLKCSEEKMLRAVTLSNLIAIYIKSKFGRLSALCGATVAGTGASCGITYLLGGDLKAVSFAVQNMIGNVTGMLCDGAKADCSLKISTCTNAAVQAALMAVKGVRIQSTDGIIEDDVEKTIDNFAMLGNRGSASMDEIILHMMMHKSKSE